MVQIGRVSFIASITLYVLNLTCKRVVLALYLSAVHTEHFLTQVVIILSIQVSTFFALNHSMFAKIVEMQQ
jgi:hypothetical protein